MNDYSDLDDTWVAWTVLAICLWMPVSMWLLSAFVHPTIVEAVGEEWAKTISLVVGMVVFWGGGVMTIVALSDALRKNTFSGRLHNTVVLIRRAKRDPFYAESAKTASIEILDEIERRGLPVRHAKTIVDEIEPD